MVSERTASSARDASRRRTCATGPQRNRTFDGDRRVHAHVGGMVMSGADGTAETVPRQWVTSGFFDVLGVRADRRAHVPASPTIVSAPTSSC